MKTNIGTTDRVIRIILALIIAGLYFTETFIDTTGIILLVIAGVFVLTGLVSFFPLYPLVGLNTCSRK